VPLLPELAELIERYLIGRNAGEQDKSSRVRIVPIPSVGHEHVDMSIRRVGIHDGGFSPGHVDASTKLIDAVRCRAQRRRVGVVVPEPPAIANGHAGIEKGRAMRLPNLSSSSSVCLIFCNVRMLAGRACRGRFHPSTRSGDATPERP